MGKLPWILWQGLISPSMERFTRYRYRSGRFTADLVADDDGIVLRYGMNCKAVATSGGLYGR
jgi:hypothetical protein